MAPAGDRPGVKWFIGPGDSDLARSSIRASLPEDIPALRALMAEAGLRLPNSEPESLHWKYWRERPDWPGPRSFVMTRGGEILAHAGVVPGAFLFQGQGSGATPQRVRALHVIDWAARPSAIGAGASLMKHLAQATDALLAIGGSAQTLRLLPHLGFRPLGTATCYVRPLRPVRILTPSTHPVSRLLPRFARSVLWSLHAPSGGIDGWSIHRIEAADLSRVASLLPAPAGGMGVLERGKDLFHYSLACPIVPMELYAIERAGQPRGYFLLSFALRQARLVDYWVNSGDPADWRALIKCAVAQAKQHSSCAELATWASDAVSSKSLLESGFHQRGALSVQILAARNPQLTIPSLRVQMLDNDAAYLHGGRNEFWA